jgi:hypothetical protein
MAQVYTVGMAYKKFLEEFPLYKKFPTDFSIYQQVGRLPKPAIHMFCVTCSSDQTFNMLNDYAEVDYNDDRIVNEVIVRALYCCSACGIYQRRFLIRFFHEDEHSEDETGATVTSKKVFMQKVGQYPGWSILMDPELEKLLGDHAEYYKRGLANEAQGYGIGALAYYRRIIEEVIDHLLESIEEFAEPEEKENYDSALKAVKNTRVTEEKIRLVKDVLPASLRPNGINPLGIIFSALSEGLHAQSEEDCLECAETIRDALVFLVNRVVKIKATNKSFSDSMKKILDKQNKKIGK